jgi:hypothetical protein
VNIHWPSGAIQSLTDVRCDKELQVDEPVGRSATPPVKEPGDHR